VSGGKLEQNYESCGGTRVFFGTNAVLQKMYQNPQQDDESLPTN